MGLCVFLCVNEPSAVNCKLLEIFKFLSCCTVSNKLRIKEKRNFARSLTLLFLSLPLSLCVKTKWLNTQFWIYVQFADFLNSPTHNDIKNLKRVILIIKLKQFFVRILWHAEFDQCEVRPIGLPVMSKN